MQLNDIREAMRCLKPFVHRTPMLESATFNAWTGAHLHLKLENLQRTGSFKLRGALNKMLHLAEQQKIETVLTASAGNHAQGVAFAAARKGIRARIYMPEHTPKAKIEATEAYGAETVLTGETYQESFAAAICDHKASGATFIHAFDDYQVMAGQGTVALEMLIQCPQLQTVLVPVGGGGLAAGVATCIKSIKPDIQVIGVQSERAPAMYNFYHRLKCGPTPHTGGIAEGILVEKPGAKTAPLLTRLLDNMVTVSDHDLARAVFLMLERCKLFVEGAGAAGLAAVLSGKVPVRGRHTGIIVSGGNADPERMFASGSPAAQMKNR